MKRLIIAVLTVCSIVACNTQNAKGLKLAKHGIAQMNGVYVRAYNVNTDSIRVETVSIAEVNQLLSK